MAEEGKWSCYEGSTIRNFKFFLEHSQQHEVMVQFMNKILPGQFERIGAGKSSLDVLGIGSGGGEMDVQMLSLLQSMFPAVPISADIVEGCLEFVDNFKALVAKTAGLHKIPFAWHIMRSEDYEKKGNMKKFDIIHMIHVTYYMDDMDKTIKFYHSLLKSNGNLMIILNAANSGWATLWKTYNKDFHYGDATQYRSAKEVTAFLKNQGLKYKEHLHPFSFDITECFKPSSVTGDRLLSFLTAKANWNQSFSPEFRAGILDFLKNKCSVEKDGRVYFDSAFSCILVHA